MANIVKSSLGPVGLDKMLVDDVGVRRGEGEGEEGGGGGGGGGSTWNQVHVDITAITHRLHVRVQCKYLHMYDRVRADIVLVHVHHYIFETHQTRQDNTPPPTETAHLVF